jgi:hypothetical protein
MERSLSRYIYMIGLQTQFPHGDLEPWSVSTAIKKVRWERLPALGSECNSTVTQKRSAMRLSMME